MSTLTARAAPAPQIESQPGVYAPDVDSVLLMETFSKGGPAVESDVLDVCCGSGIQGIAAALQGHRVVAVDSETAAVQATRRNAWVNGVEIDVCRGDLFAPVRGWRFDAVVTNPPYVPTPPGEAHAAWCDGGVDGRSLVDRICREAGGSLREGGKLWMVQSSLAGIPRTIELLQRNGFDPRIAATRELELGPVSRARRGHLVARGHLDPADDHETLAVIEAVWLR